MPVVDVQRRGQPIGRIRIGHQIRTANGKMRPAKLDTFRFTVKNRRTADAVAELYGGEVRPWTNEWEVITKVDTIPVTIPPRDQIVSQWYEMWNKGGCIRRCTSQIETLSAGQCLCPHASDPDDLEQVEAAARERLRKAKLNPPQACSLVTRISVMIPDLPGLGVFRLDTGSFYAAGETGDKADLMQIAREHGVFLPAELRIEQRQRVAEGRRTPYPVPVLEILATFREISSGALKAGGITAQLPPAPGQPQRALTAGSPPPASPLQQSPTEDGPPLVSAQGIADRAKKACSREEIESLVEEAKDARAGDDLVETKPDTFEELADFLRDRWRVLPQVSPNGGAA